MTDAQQLSSGETGRSLARIERAIEALAIEVRERHHAMGNKVDAYIGPVAVLKEQTARMSAQLDEHDASITAVKIQAGKVSFAGALLAIVAALIPWPWKVGH